MSTEEKVKSRPSGDQKQQDYIDPDRFLVLHNDDYNTFDFVIKSLVEICAHDAIQAEQCATITHYKGKCDVRKGGFTLLKPMKEELVSRGLSVTIEEL